MKPMCLVGFPRFAMSVASLLASLLELGSEGMALLVFGAPHLRGVRHVVHLRLLLSWVTALACHRYFSDLMALWRFSMWARAAFHPSGSAGASSFGRSLSPLLGNGFLIFELRL